MTHPSLSNFLAWQQRLHCKQQTRVDQLDGGQRPKPRDKRYVHLDLRLDGYKKAFYKKLVLFQKQARPKFEFVMFSEKYLARCGYLLADLDVTGTKTRKAARVGQEEKQKGKRTSQKKKCTWSKTAGNQKDKKKAGQEKVKRNGKENVIDLTSSQDSSQMPQISFWIQCKLYNLTDRAQRILLSPIGWLTDDHMLAAQKLMSVQLGFNSENEIQSTLLSQTRGGGFKPVKRFYVQVHNVSCGGGHWVLSKLDWQKKEVFLFDSYSVEPLPIDLIRQLHQLYGHMVNENDKKLHLTLVNVQRQPNGYDCGLFAIANGFEIVSGGNPGLCFYNCAVMRNHLASVFVKQVLEPFPKDTKQKRDREVLKMIEI